MIRWLDVFRFVVADCGCHWDKLECGVRVDPFLIKLASLLASKADNQFRALIIATT